MKAKYQEPIFYFNGDLSSIVEAELISKDGIYVSANLPNLKVFQLEFSFPNTSAIIKAQAVPEPEGRLLFLRFSKIDKKSKILIENYVNKFSVSKVKRKEVDL